MSDGCRGYSYQTAEGTEFSCDYEFSGEFGCEECIFGPYQGSGNLLDPRRNPHEEDEI